MCDHVINLQVLSTKGSFFSQQWKTLHLLWEKQTNFHRAHPVTLLDITAVSQLASTNHDTPKTVHTSKAPSVYEEEIRAREALGEVSKKSALSPRQGDSWHAAH